MSDSSDRDAQVFTEAIRLPRAERAAYLERVCDSDAALRRRVEALLEASEQIGDFLENSPRTTLLQSRRGVSAGGRPGDRIGNYKLLQQIGEGGCGVVFMAEQEKPVRRRLAMKIIKPGMDTKSVVARFEAERQALALMDHPNIAKVFDAGATDSGRPYFVMELVRGIKITEYCDQHSLTTQERLKLFIEVCHAIQHAHQKGIIHRDIKPSNILVTETGQGDALPVVIDFGIAKATTNQPLTDKTLFTAFEMLIGTPAYMSPEQAALTSVDVDTRSDIYSLGVLLYELLTGSTPFETEELLKAGLDEIRRVIREQEPVCPSTHLSKLAEADLTCVAQRRHSEPPMLLRAVRGDLDWIVMKALEKDRARRYVTANGLALDIQRFLANETVSARPPSKMYKLWKTVLRNKLLFAAIGAIALLLVVSLIIVSAALAKEKRARREAEDASVKSQEITKFLEEALQGVGPPAALGQDTTLLRGILGHTVERIGKEMTNQPAEEAELRDVIGTTYRQLGNYNRAEEMHRAAVEIRRQLFGSNDPRVAESLNGLGLDLQAQRKLPEAERTLAEALAIRQGLFGTNNVDTAKSMNDLGAVYRDEGKLTEAEALARQALAVREGLLGSTNLDVADSLRNLGIILGAKKNWPESEETAREVLAIRRQLLGPEHPYVASALNDLAWAEGNEGKLEEAETLQREALAIRRKVLPAEHPDVAASLQLVGDTMRKRGNLEEAYSVLSAALSMQQKLLGDDDPASIDTLRSIGLTLGAEGRWPEAEMVQSNVLALWRKRAGNESQQTLYAISDLGFALENEQKLPEAETLYRESLELSRKILGPGDPHTLYLMEQLDTLLEAQHKWAEAAAVARESVVQLREQRGDTDPHTLNTMPHLAYALEGEGKWLEAETVDRDALALWRKKAGDDDPQTLYAMRNLATVLEGERKLPEVENLCREELASWRKQAGDDDQETCYTRRKLGLTLESEDKLPEAETVFRESLAVARTKGNDDPEAVADLEKLVRVLLAEKKFGEAEQLLGDVLTPAFVRQPASVNLLIERANLDGRQGKWPEAAADSSLLVRLQPADQYQYHRLAGLLAISQNHPAYVELCQKIVATFTNTANPYVDERIAQDCLLLPQSGVDLRLADKLADLSVRLGSNETAVAYFQGCKAMSNYRLGHFSEAIEWAEKAANNSTAERQAKAKAFAVLAMANWQLGQKDAARAALAKGNTLAPDLSPERDPEDLGDSWVAWVIARISLDEATKLIQARPTTDKTSNQP